jgi:hypothetical protein
MSQHRDLKPLSVPDLKTLPVYWFFAEVTMGSFCDVGYIQQAGEGIETNVLPTEFFNHELLQVNPDDTDNLLEFTKRWGLPFTPFRNGVFGYGPDKKEALAAIESTEMLVQPSNEARTFSTAEEFEQERERVLERLQKSATVRNECLKRTGGGIISVDEARIAIRQLQEASRSLQGYLQLVTKRKKTKNPYLLPILAGASNPLVIGLKGSPLPSIIISSDRPTHRGFLTASICNQVIATIESPHRWRECAYHKCTKLFKHQNPNGKPAQSGYRFCCDGHGAAQRQQEYRNRSDHGITRRG